MGSVDSDGVRARLKEPARLAQASTQEEAERWFFDTHGCESVGQQLIRPLSLVFCV